MQDLAGLGYKDKTVVVTGGSSGMGAATAKILGELGARVHIVDLNEPPVPCEKYYKTDIANPESVDSTVAALRTIGPIHHLFNCAGVPPTLGALKCMSINYIGNRQFTEGLIPSIPRGGSIAIISSDAGLGWQKDLAQKLEFLKIKDPVAARQWCEEKPEFLRDGYTSSKEMILVWVQHDCIALGREHGIRINTIGPCPTGTAFIPEMETALEDGFFAQFPYPLLGRMATAEEQAWPLVLLNCPLNNVVTGGVLWTDQGFAPGLYTGALDAAGLMTKK